MIGNSLSRKNRNIGISKALFSGQYQYCTALLTLLMITAKSM